MQLDSSRNHIIMVNLWLSMINISVMATTILPAFFGMNLHGSRKRPRRLPPTADSPTAADRATARRPPTHRSHPLALRPSPLHPAPLQQSGLPDESTEHFYLVAGASVGIAASRRSGPASPRTPK